MKALISATIAAIIGFCAGWMFQYLKGGYHFKVWDTKKFDSINGPVTWSVVTESVGVRFLDTMKTTIDFDGRQIYKAQQDFQESAPFAKIVNVSGSTIEWTDGDYHYLLNVKKEKTEQTDALNSHAFGTFGTSPAEQALVPKASGSK